MLKIDKDFTGNILKDLIKSSSYTYDEIAEMLELRSSRVIYDWIDGIKLPSIERLFNISKIFNITLDDMLNACHL